MCCLALLLLGCGGETDGAPDRSSTPSTEAVDRAEPFALEEARTYEGILPCESCPGIRTTLQLRPDGNAQLRRLYLGAAGEVEREHVSDGVWEGDPSRIRIQPDEGEDLNLRVLGEDTLLALDSEGDPFDSDAPPTLYRILQEGPLTGLVSSMTDDEGHGLLDREWSFVDAGALPLDDVPARPHLRMESGEGTLSGSTGCNRILGGFRLEEDSLAFSPAATTRMACPEPADEVEIGILEILERTRGYRMVEGSLELLDGDDGVIARLVRP